MTASEKAHVLLDGVRVLHDEWALVAGGLTEAQLRAPSALPDWTRAHVVSHVARNADGLLNLLTWARTGIEKPMYPSAEVREQEIEDGARRGAAEIVADLLAAGEKFLEYADAMPDDTWAAEVRNRTGTAIAGSVVARMRLSEVTIHLADLGHGYDLARAIGLAGPLVDDLVEHAIFTRAAHLPAISLVGIAEDGTRYEWAMGAAAGPTVTGSCADVLAWLTGRADGSALDGDVPPLPPFK